MNVLKMNIGKYYFNKEEYNKLRNFVKIREYQMFSSLYNILKIINNNGNINN